MSKHALQAYVDLVRKEGDLLFSGVQLHYNHLCDWGHDRQGLFVHYQLPAPVASRRWQLLAIDFGQLPSVVVMYTTSTDKNPLLLGASFLRSDSLWDPSETRTRGYMNQPDCLVTDKTSIGKHFIQNAKSQKQLLQLWEGRI